MSSILTPVTNFAKSNPKLILVLVAVTAGLIWYFTTHKKGSTSSSKQSRKSLGMMTGNFGEPYTPVTSLDDVRKGGDFVLQYGGSGQMLGMKITGGINTVTMELDGDSASVNKQTLWIENPSPADLAVGGVQFKADIVLKRNDGKEISGFRKEADGKVVWVNELQKADGSAPVEQIWTVSRGQPSA